MTAGPDPAGPNVFAGAIDWLSATLLGTLASTVAILAVAAIGFMLLAGRVDIRRAVQVILGCFILFGASTIAGGIMGAVGGPDGTPGIAAAPPPAVYPAPPVSTPAPAAPSAFDPYAGAALPSR